MKTFITRLDHMKTLSSKRLISISPQEHINLDSSAMILRANHGLPK